MPHAYCCLILAKNEEKTIASVLAAARAQLQALGAADAAFVVCDDSEDRTAEIADALGARVVRAGNHGLGHAYRVGLDECLRTGAARILLLDGDGQPDPVEIPEFVAALERHGADLVTASRFIRPASMEYPYPLLNRLGIGLLARYLSLVTRQRFTDSHGGIRLMSRRLAESQRIFGRHTYVQESIIDAVGKGFRVIEIPSRWKARRHGRSRVVASVLRYARRTAPYLIYRAVWIALARAQRKQALPAGAG